MDNHQLQIINQRNKVDALKKQWASASGAHPHEQIQGRLNILLAQANLGLLLTSKYK